MTIDRILNKIVSISWLVLIGGIVKATRDITTESQRVLEQISLKIAGLPTTPKKM